MIYLLDTNTCIRHLRGTGRLDVSRRLAAVTASDVAID